MEYAAETEPASEEAPADAPMGSMAASERSGWDENMPTGDAEARVLYLSGEGAEAWLEENGEPLGGGSWRVTLEAVNALPDTLTLTAADELQKPEDNTLVITLAETEETP